MKHPLLLILDGEEFRTPELERGLQLKGWSAKWIDAASWPEMLEEGLEPSALIASSVRSEASMQPIYDFKNRDPLIPLILIGENAIGFPVSVDACIPRGAPPEAWLESLSPFWPIASSPETQMEEEVTEVFGKYRLVKRIASGGMADIYRAEQFEPQGFSRVLAIKRILPQHQQNPVFIKMLIDEANLAVQLGHQNIARIFDLGIESGTYYIAMEYVDGDNLRGLIGKAKKLGVTFPEPVAAFLIIQAAEALDYAHRKQDGEGRDLKLFHRDVSPQNILVSKEGMVKIIDFGIAKAANIAPEQTQETTLHGKLLYMSPEQSLGSPIDHRSDIYSLGLVLFELLTTEHCFQADDELGLLEKVRTGMIRDVRKVKPNISKPMARILDRVLQKNLSSRYGSARSMALDLKAYLEHLKQESMESDIMVFVRMLHTAQIQTKAFVASRFSPVKRDFALPSDKSDKTDKHSAKTPDGEVKKRKARPVWILPTVNLLMILLAYLLWLSINI